jgi:hypothetical protein
MTAMTLSEWSPARVWQQTMVHKSVWHRVHCRLRRERRHSSAKKEFHLSSRLNLRNRPAKMMFITHTMSDVEED